MFTAPLIEPGVYQLIRTGWLGSSRDSPLLGRPVLGATSGFIWVLGLQTQDLMLVHQAPYQPSCHHKPAGYRNGRPRCLSSDSQIPNEAQSDTPKESGSSEKHTGLNLPSLSTCQGLGFETENNTEHINNICPQMTFAHLYLYIQCYKTCPQRFLFLSIDGILLLSFMGN